MENAPGVHKQQRKLYRTATLTRPEGQAGVYAFAAQ